MASQNINVGTNADDGTGESLRSAFIDIRKMFAEVYNQTYTSDTQDLSGATFDLYSKPDLTLVGNTLTLTKPDATTDTVDLSPYLDEDARAIASGTINGSGIVTFTRDDASTFTLDLSSLLDGGVTSVNTQTGAVVLDSDDIAEGSTNEYYTEAKVSANTSVAANTAKVTNANHTGDVAGDTTLTIQTDAVTTAKIIDDAVTHAKLEDRYTEKGSITTYAGAVSVDWSSATNYVMGSSITNNIEFDFTGFKTGQVLTIHNLTGAYTITLDSDASTSETFNRIGSSEYDGASTNVLIVECLDDDATAVFNYSILTYTSDTTP